MTTKVKLEVFVDMTCALLLPLCLTSSNKVLTNTNDIANEFNHYFANIGNTLSQAIPRADAVFTNFLFKPLSNNLFLSPISIWEI